MSTFEQMPSVLDVISKRLERIENLLLEHAAPPISPSDLMDISQAADFLNLAVPTLYGLTSKRKLPFMKKGKKLTFSKQELTDFLKSGRQQTVSEIEENAVKRAAVSMLKGTV